MTDNMKKFLEAVSRNKESIEKLKKAETPEAVIALAAENGFTLTAEDLKPEPTTGEVSDDELNAVAGGKDCGCFLGGGGEATGKQGVCACVAAGAGMGPNGDADIRCICPVFGAGV